MGDGVDNDDIFDDGAIESGGVDDSGVTYYVIRGDYRNSSEDGSGTIINVAFGGGDSGVNMNVTNGGDDVTTMMSHSKLKRWW